MKRLGIFKGLLVSLAVLGCCLPEPLLAAGASGPQTPAVGDVVLKDGGVLIGQVVDPQGIPLAKMPVSLRDRNREIAAAATDGNGYFAFRGLRGGVYQVVTPEGQRSFRLWVPGTAPPSSEGGALVVVQRTTVRGQDGEPTCSGPTCAACPQPTCTSRACGFFCNPLVVAGIVATAVAVPVIVHNNRRHPASP